MRNNALIMLTVTLAIGVFIKIQKIALNKSNLKSLNNTFRGG